MATRDDSHAHAIFPFSLPSNTIEVTLILLPSSFFLLILEQVVDVTYNITYNISYKICFVQRSYQPLRVKFTCRSELSKWKGPHWSYWRTLMTHETIRLFCFQSYVYHRNSKGSNAMLRYHNLHNSPLTSDVTFSLLNLNSTPAKPD